MMNSDRRRTQTTSGPGWLATAGGALLLIALGFGVGIVAGTAYQEPELVVDHLAGRSTDVVLEPAGVSSGAPDVAAPAPPVAAALAPPVAAALGEGALEEVRRDARPPAAEPASAAAPERRVAVAPRPAPAPAPTTEGFSIQVGAFSSEKAARQLASELGRQGYDTYLMDEGGGARWKVRVGPLATRSEAEAISVKLKRDQRLPTWIQANS
jgi:cell division septation protein DedD